MRPAVHMYITQTGFLFRFSKYWRGEHHIEEMMYLENCSRYELLQVLDKFSAILVKHEHEDPVVTKYWSQTL